jgi:hypothetical protein
MKKLAFNEIKDQMKGINVLKSTEIVRVDTEQVSDNSDSEVLFQRKKVKLSAMEKIFGKTTESPKEVSINEEFKSYINIAYDPNCDLFNWWQQNENEFPRLAKLAKKYLSIPSTSVSSERIFLTAGNLITKKRSALNPYLVNKLVFLKKNFKHFDS